MIPLPKPSTPSKPRLTRRMLEHAKASGAASPGAGGWVPSQVQTAAIGALGVGCGALVTVLPVPWNTIVGALGGGLVYFAVRSAGPRTPTE